jgi:tRNA threonylcarbamoyladenosine modification (KEOPS) complex  Pcc1 subunit
MVASSTKSKLQLKLILKKEQKLNYTRILTKSLRHKRSNISIKETKDKLIIKIKAEDATALRASINTLIRDLQVIEATKL